MQKEIQKESEEIRKIDCLLCLSLVCYSLLVVHSSPVSGAARSVASLFFVSFVGQIVFFVHFCLRLLALAASVLSNLEISFPSQPFGLISFVSPYDVAPLVRLEIPWRDQNDVSLPYPHSSLHFSSDSAEALLAVLATH